MKKIKLIGLKAALILFAGTVALFVAEKSAGASFFWFMHQPPVPKSLLKKE